MPLPSRSISLLLAGDVMVGRGIDQILPHPGDPDLFEPWVKKATTYVELAAKVSGPIRRPVDFAYPWGDFLPQFNDPATDARIINLETAVTRATTPYPGKGIHYRLEPKNAPVLTAAGFDLAILANNHVLDWGRAGLAETLATLKGAGIATAGAGDSSSQAQAPCRHKLNGHRLLIFAAGVADSGIPPSWAAGENRSGIHFLPDLDGPEAQRFLDLVGAHRSPGTTLVASLHWGPNWGHIIDQAHQRFARRLIDAAGVAIVFGHSSHHPKAIEIHRRRLILYGCGDLINDYEGIASRPDVGPDLGLIYRVRLAAEDGRLLDLRLVPTATRRLRLVAPGASERQQMAALLNRHGINLGRGLAVDEQGTLVWRGGALAS